MPLVHADELVGAAELSLRLGTPIGRGLIGLQQRGPLKVVTVGCLHPHQFARCRAWLPVLGRRRRRHSGRADPGGKKNTPRGFRGVGVYAFSITKSAAIAIGRILSLGFVDTSCYRLCAMLAPFAR